MSFADPLLLVAGLAVVAACAVAYAIAQRRPRGAAFASGPVAAAVAPRRPRWRRHLAPLLYGLAAVALVVALAKPQTTVAVPVEQATVMLVTDVSRSMAATDVAPNRLDAARSAAGRFLDEVPEDLRVGAVAFNNRARLLQNPTTDREPVREALAGLTPRGGTATGEGLSLALAAARQPVTPGADPPPAAIILLADGNSSSGRDAFEVAREARAAKVPIHTVALGTGRAAVPGAGSAGVDAEALRRIAEISGGRSATAENADELSSVYEDLGSRVGTREEERQVTAAAAGAGLLLLLAGGGLSLLTFGRLP